MTTVQKSIEVNKDVRTVYNQWTQFEKFPEFMDGVDKVIQLDDTHLRWNASIYGASREWEAEIVEQVPDQVIAWRSTGQVENAGRVTFDKLADDKTRVNLTMKYEPSDFVEKAGDKLNLIEMRVQGDLERFKKFMEQQGTETGAWRGEVHGGQKTGEPGTTGMTTGTSPGAGTTPTTTTGTTLGDTSQR